MTEQGLRFVSARTNWRQLFIADGVDVACKARKQPCNFSNARLTTVITIPISQHATAHVHPAVRHCTSTSFKPKQKQEGCIHRF